MIVAVGSDKGSPGVTTLSTLLALLWPGQRLLLEADPSGADLPFRLHTHGGGRLAAEPSILSLAAMSRTGLPAADLTPYTQQTTLGVPVIPGALSAEAFAPMRTLWAPMVGEAARWSGTVIADVGRIQPGNPGAALVQSATAVVLLATPTLEGLYHLRDRIGALANMATAPTTERSRVVVVVRAAPRAKREALSQVRQLLQAMGSPVEVAGLLADDPAAAAALGSADLPRRFDRSPLVRTAQDLVGALVRWWPQLGTDPPPVEVPAADLTAEQVPR